MNTTLYQQSVMPYDPGSTLANTSSQGTEPPTQKPTLQESYERIRYVLEEHRTNNKWYVIYEKIDGKERFNAQEAWEQGEWREHKPHALELAAARELMAQKKGMDNWEQTIPIDDFVVNVIADLGKFPTCIRSAIHEFSDLHLDPSNQQHAALASGVRDHIQRGEQLIAQVYAWFEEHRYYRSIANRLKMKG
jgi:hypothetical protein